MGPINREIGPRLKAAVAASAELQERDALKSVGLAAAIAGALVARGLPELSAHLAGELGVLAFKRGYAQWSEENRGDGTALAHRVLAALDDLRTARRHWANKPMSVVKQLVERSGRRVGSLVRQIGWTGFG